MTSARRASWIAAIAMICVAGTASAQLQVRLVHIAPFAADAEDTSVSISIQGQGEGNTNFGVRYGDIIDYQEITEGGEYVITVTPTGASEPVIQRNQGLEDGEDYTIAVIGNGASNFQSLTVLVLTDDNSETTAGTGRSRFVHAAPFASTAEASEVAIRTDAGGEISEEGVTLTYPQRTPFLDLPAGSYDLKITTVDGTTNLIDPEEVELSEGDIVTFFATGDGSNQDLGVLAVTGGFPGGGFLDLEDTVDLSFSGSWNNSETNGQGFSIEALPSQDRVLIYWFTFNTAGDEQAWFTADTANEEGRTFKDNVANMTVFEATGGRFNDPDAEVSNDEVGTLTVEFTSCTEGTAEYDLTVGGEELEGSFDIERISPVVDCTATFDDDNL